MSFGETFGKLVKRKRGIEGLTQQALATKAFGDENFKSRISDLENGKVASPQPKTIDALVVALGISHEELSILEGSNPHAQHVDNLTDYADLEGTVALDIEVAVNAEGKAVLFHNRDFKVGFVRVEFFPVDRELVFVTKGRSRRPAGLPLGRDVCFHLEKCAELIFVRIFDDGKAVEHSRCPILIVPQETPYFYDSSRNSGINSITQSGIAWSSYT
ncbi:helix-turn-helix domain-containing protein [Citromicrobium bathyomarinum]|uniref:helix-turn-helix domain-containing protein n=1 Tax=Citromicrobium bathyomarinum TaxID=72174 RepID=UPI001E4EB0E2|nr:helix-turn-helix transcriptional regulator [Citromicrobium bathyomarinum]MCD1624335.1 helix-turn-helix transcriptional regulator [Citromicrobium bathyomarinum]